MQEDSTKRLYVKDVKEWKKRLSVKRFSDRKLEVKVIERGIILPARKLENDKGYEGGVCDENFNFVAGFSRSDGIKSISPHISILSSYNVNREEIVEFDEDVIFGGALLGHFGHFIMESWNRLWYVIQHPELKHKILFIPYAHGGYHSYFDEFFRLMGISKDRIVYVKQPTQCRSVIVPDQSQYSFINFTKEYMIPYQAIKAHVKPGVHKKLYLTRTEDVAVGKSKRWDAQYFNYKYFEDFFSARDFEVVCMDKMTIEEQISLVMGADEIVAITGTLTNWAIFCKPSTKFIMLNRIHKMTAHFQSLANEAVALKNYCFVDVSKNFMYAKHANGACMLGSTKYWTEFVADYFGEQIGEDDDTPYIEEALDKYVDFWCEKYCDPKSENFDKVVDSFKSMCNRIITLERMTSKKRPFVTYQTHVSKNGWGAWKSENQLSNSLNQKQDIQAIKIDFPSHKVYYAVYWNDKEGWSEEVVSPEIAGTTGESKPITGVKIRLDEAGAKNFDILYRVHKFSGGWTAWLKNGEELLSQGVKLNAIQINLQTKSNRPSFSYQTHVSKKGWGDGWKSENQLSNPLDQKYDIQAIKINSPSHKVFCAVYWNDAEGWSEEVASPEMAGTTGKSKPIFGIKMRLDESGAKEFDILYRVHNFDGEWTDWAKNSAEILSQGVKLNSIQIKLEPKSDSPPLKK